MSAIVCMISLALLASLVLSLVIREKVHQKRLHLRVQKLYASQLFEDMLDLLRVSKKLQIEQITVDKVGVSFRYLNGKPSETAFLMRSHGYAYLSCEQQEAMRSMLEECIPKLQDERKYHLIRKRVVLLNGDIEYLHRYTISNEYKASLSRIPQYNPSLASPLWQ